MSGRPSPDEIADRYLDSRARVLGLLEPIPDGADVLTRVVPGTPKWTVQDLVAHLVGCPIDLAAGRVDGAGGERWTQAQVATRAGDPLRAVLDEWSSKADDIEAAIRSGAVPVPVTYDILTHESDLRGALGAERVPDARGVRFLAEGFGRRAVRAAAEAGLPPLRLRAGDSDWGVGEPGGLTGVAEEFEWTRALTGRRSKSQVRAYDWDGDPSAYLDVLCPFGALPEADVIE